MRTEMAEPSFAQPGMPAATPAHPVGAPARRRFLYYGVVYVVLWIGTWYLARLMNTLGFVSLWFLPSGLRFCNLLVFGRRGLYLELVIQGIFAAVQFTPLDGPPIQAVFSENTFWRAYNLLSSLAVTVAVVFPLRRWMREPWDLAQPKHSVLLVSAAVLVSAFSGLAGALGLVRLGFVQPEAQMDVVGGWLAGDLVGILSLTPLLLVRVVPTLQRYLATGHWRRWAASFDDVWAAITVWLALLFVFGIPWSFNLNTSYPIVTLFLLLPLAGIAMHYGLRTATLAIVLLDLGMVLLIAAFNIQERALPYQLVMVAIALVGVWLGGAVEARNRVVARYRDFASVSNDLLWEADGHGHVFETSGRLARYASLASGRHWQEMLKSGPDSALTALGTALAGQQSFHNLEFELPDEGDGTHWIRVSGRPVFDDVGELAGYRGTAEDVTLARQAAVLLRNYNEQLLKDVAERTHTLHQTNGELQAKERHLQVILAAAPVGVLELDEARRCAYINVNGCTMTGHTQDEALGRPLLDFVHPDDRDYVDFVFKINQQSEEVHWIEFRLERTHQRCSAHWINVPGPVGEAGGTRTILVLTSATARAQQDERLWTLAHHDSLTDLPNRNLFWDRMGQALRYARRNERGAAVLWIDLDGFKNINDRFGHAAGDLLLQQVAQRLRGRIRESDTVARMGGDEFAVIMPDTGAANDALHTANALVASLAEPFALPQGEAHISGSIGVALYPQHATSVESLTQCADMAMYQAKNAGKNQVRLWGAAPNVTSG